MTDNCNTGEDPTNRLNVSNEPPVHQPYLSNDRSVHQHIQSSSMMHRQNTYLPFNPHHYYYNHSRNFSGGPYVSQSELIQHNASSHFFPNNHIQPCPSVMNGNGNHMFQGHSEVHPAFLSSNLFPHPSPQYPTVYPGQVINPIQSPFQLSSNIQITSQYPPPQHPLNTCNVENHGNFNGVVENNVTNSSKGQRDEAKSILLDPLGIQCNENFPQTLRARPKTFHWLFLYKLKSPEPEKEVELTLSTKERAIIARSNIYMGAQIQDSNVTRSHSKPCVIKICKTVCKGYKRETCNLEYLWVRGGGEIGCYVRTRSTITSPTSLCHSVGCKQSRHKVDDIVENDFHEARKLGMTSDSKYLSVGKSIVTCSNDPKHSSRNFKQKEVEKLNDYCKKEKKKIKDLDAIIGCSGDKFDGESMKTIEEYLNNNMMTTDTFVELECRYETMSTEELRQIVVFKHDVCQNRSGEFKCFVFTTIGNLGAYINDLKKAELTHRTSSEIDVSGCNGIAVAAIGTSDFNHSFFEKLFAIVQSENKLSVEPLMHVNLEIMTKLSEKIRKSHKTLRHEMLKDGGPSFISPSQTLGYEESSCLVHKFCPADKNKKAKQKKKFKSGSSSHRGSCDKFLINHGVVESLRNEITYKLMCLHATSTSLIAYTHAQKLFIQDLLEKFPIKEIVDNSNPDECLKVILRKYGHILQDIKKKVKSGDDIQCDNKGVDVIVDTNIPLRYNQLGTHEKIIVHIIDTYAPIVPTYGPHFVDGNVFCTCGLEGKWNSLQHQSLHYTKKLNYGPVQAFIKLVQDNSGKVDNFKCTPVETTDVWDYVLKFCDTKSPKEKLPEWLSYVYGYDNLTGSYISTDELMKSLDNISNFPRGLTLYLPTRYNFHITMKQVLKKLCNKDNSGGYGQTDVNVDSVDGKQVSKLLVPMHNAFCTQMEGEFIFFIQFFFDATKHSNILTANFLSSTTFKDLDPYVTTFQDKNGDRKNKSFGQYVFQHATREANAMNLLKINTKKKTVSKDVDKVLSKTMKYVPGKNDQKSIRDIHQRALGQFMRVVISKDEVICNCENHKRFRNCNEKCLFKLLYLPVHSFSEDNLSVRPMKTGRYQLKQNQNWLRTALRKRKKENLEMMRNCKDFCNSPPEVDPFMKVNKFYNNDMFATANGIYKNVDSTTMKRD